MGSPLPSSRLRFYPGAMSNPPINLNKTRKERLKAEANSKAAMNRIAFGRTKAEKKAEMIRKSKAAKALDGAKREP